ncbi:MAG TPA: TylF/MycF family methyltransferase [Pyrinomonadaceae bacterium]|nr:TylF/MycF family methyltransferase [Pyrinomonadaceae bacterium]
MNATARQRRTSKKPINSALGRDLYLDLLIKILANTIYEDPSIHPSNTGEFQSELRSVGRDWPQIAHSMIGVQRLENVRQLVQRVLDENVPGDLIETGVWRGGCCILMRGVLAANDVSDRKVFVADSFEGLPPPDTESYPADEGMDLHLYQELAVSLEEVQSNFARYGLLDEQVVFLKGFFKDTLPTLETGPFAVIRLDGDLYESIYLSLEALYPKLSPGGFAIIDDFNFLPPCTQAVLDYRAQNGITAPMYEVDWSASWWQKPNDLPAPLGKRVITSVKNLIAKPPARTTPAENSGTINESR